MYGVPHPTDLGLSHMWREGAGLLSLAVVTATSSAAALASVEPDARIKGCY